MKVSKGFTQWLTITTLYWTIVIVLVYFLIKYYPE